MLIIISGMPGSGKSTVARQISKKMCLDYICAGHIFRDLGIQEGYSDKGKKFVAWNKHVQSNPQVDEKIDREIIKRAKKGNVVVDSWLAGHLIKKADLKIFLKVDMNSSIERINIRDGTSKKEAQNETKNRLKISKERWKKLYNVDIDDLSPFDFVFDTTRFSQEQMKEVINLVLKLLFDKNQKKVNTRRCLK